MRTELRESLPSVLKIFAAYLLMVTVISLLPGKIPYETVREGGPVEVLSAYGYFLFCLFLLYFNLIGLVRTRFAPGFFVLLLGLRELDFHARFTTMGMFKIKFFLSPEVPLLEKTLVSLFIVFLLVYGWLYLGPRIGPFWRDLKAGRPYAVSVLMAVFCLVASKGLDGNSEILEPLFFMLEDTSVLGTIMEECLEMFIPLFLVRALIQYAESEQGRIPLRRG